MAEQITAEGQGKPPLVAYYIHHACTGNLYIGLSAGTGEVARYTGGASNDENIGNRRRATFHGCPAEISKQLWSWCRLAQEVNEGCGAILYLKVHLHVPSLC